MGPAYSVSTDTIANDITLHLCKPWTDYTEIDYANMPRSVTPNNPSEPKSARKSTQYSLKLSDMEIVCDGKKCRLVPSGDVKTRKPRKLLRKKKGVAPLPPIDEVNILDYSDSESSEPSHSESQNVDDRLDTKSEMQTVSENNSKITNPRKATLDLKDMNWVAERYDVTGELGRLSGVSEIEYML